MLRPINFEMRLGWESITGVAALTSSVVTTYIRRWFHERPSCQMGSALLVQQYAADQIVRIMPEIRFVNVGRTTIVIHAISGALIRAGDYHQPSLIWTNHFVTPFGEQDAKFRIGDRFDRSPRTFVMTRTRGSNAYIALRSKDPVVLHPGEYQFALTVVTEGARKKIWKSSARIRFSDYDVRFLNEYKGKPVPVAPGHIRFQSGTKPHVKCFVSGL